MIVKDKRGYKVYGEGVVKFLGMTWKSVNFGGRIIYDEASDKYLYRPNTFMESEISSKALDEISDFIKQLEGEE